MQRRNFIKLSSLSLLGLYSCGLNGHFTTSKPLGLQLYTVRDEISKNLETTLEKLAALGFKNLEIYGYNGTFFGKTAKEFKQILKNTGLKVISSHHISELNPKSTKIFTAWELAAEDLMYIDAKYMVYAYLFPEQRTFETYRSLPEILVKFGEISQEGGMQFAYHNHDFEFEMMDGEPIYDFLLKNTSEELVKMELDLYWITKAGYSATDYFKKYPGRFPLWHVKDMLAETKDFAEVGSGTIDFDKIFAAREIAGLKYWFIEQDESRRNIFESLRMSRDYVIKKRY